jgi:phage-related protein
MKRVPANFFRTASGQEPVREWLKAMDVEDRRRIGEDIKTVEYGWPIGMPTCRPMGDRLHELRTRLTGNRIVRLLFYIDRQQRMVVLHGFIKKSRETPAADLALARANKQAHERSLT